ncbi:MAG TPA: hypothetical protein EYP02_02450, partial [Sulfurovum sp.]|nr:hypothetical protein [Sulfurovum sp.]
MSRASWLYSLLLSFVLSGEVRWADLNSTVGREQLGLRPVLILSDNQHLSQ